MNKSHAPKHGQADAPDPGSIITVGISGTGIAIGYTWSGLALRARRKSGIPGQAAYSPSCLATRPRCIA